MGLSAAGFSVLQMRGYATVNWRALSIGWTLATPLAVACAVNWAEPAAAVPCAPAPA